MTDGTAAAQHRTKTLARPCPVCGASVGEVLHTQSFKLPDDYPLPTSYDVVACVRCGFVYADTEAVQADYDRFYRDFSKYEDTAVSSGGGGSELDRARLAETARSIVTHLTSADATILDIGCANGGLLRALKGLGFANVTGLDPSPACVRSVNGVGIECHLGGIFDRSALAAGRRFDCVILSHVMEHIRDLGSAVSVLIDLVAPGGILYIEVPDGSRYADYFVVPNYYFDCEHINHFDEHSLANLFGPAGLAPVETVKKTIRVSGTIDYPAVGLFLGTAATTRKTFIIEKDSRVRDSVVGSVEQSRSAGNGGELEALAAAATPVVVWGAGSYALRLLGEGPLGRCAIIAFIDKDRSKQGKQINGVNVFPPEKLREMTDPIVICSALFAADIAAEIKGMGLTNRLVIP